MPTFTNNQMYVLPTIALLIAIIALALASAQFTSSVTDVHSTNGFVGMIKNKKLTLGTTVLGVIKGEAGAIRPASSEDITANLLTGFTPIIGAGPILQTDTILQGFGKMQGNSNYLFSVYASDFKNSATLIPLYQPLFSIPNVPVIPANLFKLGTTVVITTHGQAQMQGGTLILTFTSTFGNQEIVSGAYTGTYLFEIQSTLSCGSFTQLSTQLDVLHVAKVYVDPFATGIDIYTTKSQGITIIPTANIAVGLSGSISGVNTQTLGVLNAFGSIVFTS